MLPLQKNREIIEQIRRIQRRVRHLQQVKDQQFSFITLIQQLYSNYSQKIHQQMINFEQAIIKTSLYSSHKSSNIINMAKVYREFSMQLQSNSKINILNLQGTRQDQIVKQQQRLQKKCEIFLKQFEQYMATEKKFNSAYSGYQNLCTHLDEIIQRYRSYENPVSFYNQTLTNEYLAELQQKYSECATTQTSIITETQMLDQNRTWLCNHVKEINEFYVILLHLYLTVIESTVNYIVDPTKELGIEKDRIGLRSSELEIAQNRQSAQLKRLDDLYSVEEDNLLQDFSQLFTKQVNLMQVNSDYKFFYDRCENIRSKKIKRTEEICQLQSMAVNEIHRQQQNYYALQKQYRSIEKKVFASEGVEIFKKQFRKYFGANFLEVEELCMHLMERQKNSLQKICKSMESSEEKLSRLLVDKRQNMKSFSKLTGMILEEHQSLKSKAQGKGSADGESLQRFKASIGQSLNEFKKTYQQMQKSEREMERLFFKYLKEHYETILKEAINKNLSRLLQRQQRRMEILSELNIDSEIITILKEDSGYGTLLSDCPKPNLYSSFQSRINKKQYEDTKILLMKKQDRLKNMIRSKQSCCGIKSEPIKFHVLTSHQCTILDKDSYEGVLSVSASGLIFEESSWNPFKDNLKLMIPQTDIQLFDSKMMGDKEVVQIGTDFGSIIFWSKQNSAIIESIQKNISFKPAKESSERINRKNDSSSFLNNNSSTEFKLSYDKTLNSNIQNPKTPSTVLNNGKRSKSDQGQGKVNGLEQKLKDLSQRWKKDNFFSKHFTVVMRNPPFPNDDRHDFSYKNSHSKFYLKQRRTTSFQGKDFCLNYEWKISFPDSPMLHSFKHYETVRLQNIQKQMRIRVVMAKSSEEQLYIKNTFYKEIEEMNNVVCRFIVQFMEREADVIMEADDDGKQSLDNCEIVLDDVNLEDRESKVESMLKNSKIKSSSTLNGKTSGS